MFKGENKWHLRVSVETFPPGSGKSLIGYDNVRAVPEWGFTHRHYDWFWASAVTHEPSQVMLYDRIVSLFTKREMAEFISTSKFWFSQYVDKDSDCNVGDVINQMILMDYAHAVQTALVIRFARLVNTYYHDRIARSVE